MDIARWQEDCFIDNIKLLGQVAALDEAGRREYAPSRIRYLAGNTASMCREVLEFFAGTKDIRQISSSARQLLFTLEIKAECEQQLPNSVC